jgi:hypothetical protein
LFPTLLPTAWLAAALLASALSLTFFLFFPIALLAWLSGSRGFDRFTWFRFFCHITFLCLLIGPYNEASHFEIVLETPFGLGEF